METEDKLKQMVEGVESLHFVLAIASEYNVIVPNVHALLNRTLSDIDALCGEQMARADEGRP